MLKDRRQWRIPAATLALGIYGLFGYHFLLFSALHHAPPVEANLVNYLWPLFMAVLAPLFLVGLKLRTLQMVAALLGFGDAAIAILGTLQGVAGTSGWCWRFLPALASAFIWASYSLLTQRVKAFPTTTIGLFGLVSGLLSLLCHWALESPVTRSGCDWLLLALIGLGPAGRGLFPLGQGLETRRCLADRHPELHHAAGLDRPLTGSIALAAAMILGAAVLGIRTK